MYVDRNKDSGGVACSDDSCRIDQEKLRDAQARFGTSITRAVESSSGEVVLIVFGKDDCPVCDEARAVIQSCIDKPGVRSDLTVRHFDLDTADGLMEGSLRNALEVPTTILEWQGDELDRWENTAPSRDILISKISALPVSE
ncbi:MAG: hypothetical protein U9N73_10920 [Candidatus Auribacterota bacterium]|nr:hypothetical protein [Candidatus Auribacterota bacterium]